MKFISVLGQSPAVSFPEALFQGISPDGSLYIPEHLPKLPSSLLRHLEDSTLYSIGAHIASLFIEEIPAAAIRHIVERAWNFPIPLVKLDEKIFLLELFHGPTLAFKDVGARFMAEVMSYFLEQDKREVTIIVATSGDTGSAVAHGFFNVPHVNVYILYPSGKISRLQEQQMTTLGGNIHAIEVEGTFDDCQRLVKQALADPEILKEKNLTTANSINVGRLIPQIAYYIWGIAQWKRHNTLDDSPTIVVPSGNFGNLTAALYAKWMGTPIKRFIAATNVNDVVPQYLRSGNFVSRPSMQTISNAMDVGNPSNLARLQALCANDVQRIRCDIDGISMSDEATLSEMRDTYKRCAYVLDPHTAVGVAAARNALEANHTLSSIIVAATAHAGKFPEIVEPALGIKLALPQTLQEALKRPKQSTRIAPNYESLKTLLQ